MKKMAFSRNIFAFRTMFKAKTGKFPLVANVYKKQKVSVSFNQASFLSSGASFQGPVEEDHRCVFITSAKSQPNTLKSVYGEDAYFVSECGRAIGIADGVHYSQPNIESAKYSREV